MPETLVPTPTADILPRRFADFETLGEALDYAALGAARPQLPRSARGAGPRLSLSRASRGRARRRLSADRGGREARRTGSRSSPRPAPNSPPSSSAPSMPAPGRCRCRLPTSFGGRDSYIDQLKVQLDSADPTHLFYPGRARRHGRRRGRGGGSRRAIAWESFAEREAPGGGAAARPSPTTSPISNIRAARPASRTGSRSPIAAFSTTSPRTATAWR